MILNRPIRTIIKRVLAIMFSRRTKGGTQLKYFIAHVTYIVNLRSPLLARKQQYNVTSRYVTYDCMSAEDAVQ